MRLTTVILLVSLLQVSASTFGQRITINQKNAALESVLKEIRKQSGYGYYYGNDVIPERQKINIAVTNASLEEALTTALQGLKLRFEIEDKVIVIKKKEPSFLERIVNRFAAIDVRGRVVDSETGKGLQGATIKVKGTNKQTYTSGDGEFNLENVDDNAILEISYIGYAIKEIPAAAEMGNIRLVMALSELQEVTINKGYYTEKKMLSTGSVSKVTADEIARQPVSNPVQTLQGRMAGVYIEQVNGLPGSALRINIRGRQSIQNGTEPLFIVDGVPYNSQTFSNGAANMYGSTGTSPLNNINPNDIESIEVLKDADATAIYGSRGANGVVLITTKNGKKGVTKLDVNFLSGFSEVANELELLNTQQHLDVRKQGFKNDNSSPTSYQDFDVNGVWDTTRYTNWQRELLGGTANFTNAQATVSGGMGNSQFSSSATYQKQGTVFPGNATSDRGAIHFSIANKSSNQKFKSRFNASYSIGQSRLPGLDLTATAIGLAPNAPRLYEENGDLNFENSTWTNPLALLNQKFQADNHNLICNTNLGYEILNGLTINASLGISDVSNAEKTLSPSTVYDPALGVTSSESTAFTSNAFIRSWIAEPQINYENNEIVGGKLSIITGGSFQSQNSSAIAINYFGFSTNSLIDDPNSASFSDVQNSTTNIYRYAAIFARINYSYEDRYIINITGRRDGSSRFGPGKQYATLGALGAAWIFSNEGFLKGRNSVISFGKLRASYGTTGNDQIGDYNYLDTYLSSGSTYQGVTGLAPLQLFNPNYSWETTRKIEVAIEAGFANDRILFTAAYFNNQSSNQLVNYKLANTSGFTSVLKNLPAKIENSGFEFEINTANMDRIVKWSTSFNLTIPKNKLIAFPNIESSSYAKLYSVGRSLNIVKQYHLLGVDPKTGLYTFDDMNGDGLINIDDKMQVSDIGEKYYGGISNTVSYKGLSLDVFFQFVTKKDYDVYYGFLSRPGESQSDPIGVLQGVWKDEDNPGRLQRYSATQGSARTAYSRFRQSDAIIVDASFIRLKNVSLTYSFPTEWTRGVSSRVFIQGQNLLTITKYKGLDPENGSSTSLPPLRTIVVGAQITF